MKLIPAQRKQLAAARKLLRSSEWPAVQQALALLAASNDPQLWAIMAEGISISSSGRLQVGPGEIRKRTKAANRDNAALHVARPSGLLSGLSLLDLSGSFDTPNQWLSDLQPLQGLTNLTTLDLSYCASLSDLQPLQGLTSLTTLSLAHGFSRPGHSGKTLSYVLQDLSSLSALVNLSSLDLCSCNGVTDLRPLYGLTRLRRLNLLFCRSVSDPEAAALQKALPELTIAR